MHMIGTIFLHETNLCFGREGGQEVIAVKGSTQTKYECENIRAPNLSVPFSLLPVRTSGHMIRSAVGRGQDFYTPPA